MGQVEQKRGVQQYSGHSQRLPVGVLAANFCELFAVGSYYLFAISERMASSVIPYEKVLT